VVTSDSKTHVSKDTYEFAKRWFHRGIEVTGISTNGLITQRYNPIGILGFIVSLYDKNQTPDTFMTSIEVTLKFLRVFTSEKVKFNRSRNLVRNLYAVMRYTRGHETELRTLFSEALLNNDNIMPQFGQTMLEKEFSRVGQFVANGILFEATRMVSKWFNIFTAKQSEIINLNASEQELDKAV
jgi:hypothetical protein